MQISVTVPINEMLLRSLNKLMPNDRIVVYTTSMLFVVQKLSFKSCEVFKSISVWMEFPANEEYTATAPKHYMTTENY